MESVQNTGRNGYPMSKTVIPLQVIEQSLYAERQKIQPRAVRGWFAGWRWVMVWLTQLIFYGLPWLSWNDRPAILFDLAARKFYLFGLVLWPQDFIYLAWLLVISALGLFLFTALAGRLFCGYACPQSVYTQLFMWIEYQTEGDRAARLKLDAAPWHGRKLLRRGSKHLLWLLLAGWTGFTFTSYFTPVQQQWQELVALSLGPWQTFWMVFYSLATYGNAGWLREQVCQYMCPYARFQSAMFDRDTLIVTYDDQRGEPRGQRRQQRAGQCIDCHLCVQVCPTGIDIREGLQYECIGCGACIDVCNQVMDKIQSPRGLIRYSTANALAHGWNRQRMWQRMARPRIVIYATLWLALVAGCAISLWLRSPLKVDVIRDRGSLAREVDNGAIENVYRLQIMNTAETARHYTITATDPTQRLGRLQVVHHATVALGPASARLVPIRIEAHPPAGSATGSHRILIHVDSPAAGDRAAQHRSEHTVFYLPR
jgi:cytochrome c oxidase accessory protein FixG